MAIQRPNHVARAAVAALTLALIAGACAPASTSPAAPTLTAASTGAPAPTPSGPPVTVTIGVASSISYAPLWVGVERGIYLNHGIDLKIKTVTAAQAGITGLQSGELQLSTSSWSTNVAPVAQGVPIKVVGLLTGSPNVKFYDDQISLMVATGSTATSIVNLKGKTIAVQFGAGPDTWLRAQLKNAGLNAETDVKLVNVPVSSQLSVIQSKAADAVVPTEPVGSQILSLVPGTRVLLRGGGIVDGRAIITGLGPWIAQNAKLVDQIVAAHLESEQYVRQHPDDAAVITSHYVSGVDVSVLTAALKSDLK